MKKLIGTLILAGSSLFAGPRIAVGVDIGVPVAPPPVVASGYVAPAPGPGYTWVAGYWYPVGGRYIWHAGYWARPPYRGSVWIAPRYHAGRYYAGHWRR